MVAPKSCECGCGAAAPIATRTHSQKGHVKGRPLRFIRGHATRGTKRSAEEVSKRAHALRGKQAGAANSQWKGGKLVHSSGYVVVYAPEHPQAILGGKYVREHRLVMERVLGRYLTPDEVVHHIDGNKLNNDPRNLEVMARADHTRLHRLEAA